MSNMEKQPNALQGTSLTTGRKNLGKQELNELARLATPLVDWLRSKYDMHTEIHISWDRVKTVADELSIPFPYDEV